MKEITLRLLFKKESVRPVFLILCSLLISGTALARKHWDRSYFDVWKKENTLQIIIKVFDYDFGPRGENGYLKVLFCEYSTDGVDFYHFMTASTGNQENLGNLTWVDMKDKLRGAKIKFCYCINPTTGTLWAENQNYRVELFNRAGGKTACFGVIWGLEEKYENVQYLRISGTWRVKGLYSNDVIYNEVYPINKVIVAPLKPPKFINVNTPVIDKPENIEIKVCKNRNAVIVQGARTGEAIQVYSTSGALLESIIVNDDVVKIPLSTNQIYIVHVGQSRCKVAM